MHCTCESETKSGILGVHLQVLVQNAQETIAEAEKQQAAVATSTSEADEKIEAKQQELDRVKAELEEIEAAAKGAKSDQRKLQAQWQAEEREAERQERIMEACITAAQSVARDAMLTQVDLACRSGLAAAGVASKRSRKDAAAEASTSTRRSRKRSTKPRPSTEDSDVEPEREQVIGKADDEEMMDVEGLEAEDGESVPCELQADFPCLPRDLMRDLDGISRKKKEVELEKEIEEIAERLEQTAPNLKAPEQYEEVVQEGHELQKVSFPQLG
jgi:chromosome segregation ATPase